MNDEPANQDPAWAFVYVVCTTVGCESLHQKVVESASEPRSCGYCGGKMVPLRDLQRQAKGQAT